MLTTRFAFLIVALLAAANASAQETYRWVDQKSGQTIFSDQPPPPGAKQVLKMNGKEQASDQQMPYATRQAAEKFPVTLYTAANCMEACKQARELLNGRGIPFSEKMLKSEEDIAELTKKLGSEAATPSIFVGQQSFKGFEAGTWNNLLDLAGYPKSAPYGAKKSGAFAQ